MITLIITREPGHINTEYMMKSFPLPYLFSVFILFICLCIFQLFQLQQLLTHTQLIYASEVVLNARIPYIYSFFFSFRTSFSAAPGADGLGGVRSANGMGIISVLQIIGIRKIFTQMDRSCFH